MRAPMAPGNGGRSNPARVWPQRVQVMSAIAARLVPARVLHFREPDQLQHANVRPADVELEPLRREARGLRIGVVVVVELLAAEPDRDGRDVPALVLHRVIPVADRMADAVDDAGGP